MDVIICVVRNFAKVTWFVISIFKTDAAVGNNRAMRSHHFLKIGNDTFWKSCRIAGTQPARSCRGARRASETGIQTNEVRAMTVRLPDKAEIFSTKQKRFYILEQAIENHRKHLRQNILQICIKMLPRCNVDMTVSRRKQKAHA
ncbi:hypothetical protein [Paraburkholderia sp. 2C]